jgi:hypothetical protein
MKGYEEFKGYRTRIVYDPKTKAFTTRTLANAEFPGKASKKKRAARARKAAKKHLKSAAILLRAIAP